jgi:5-(carboxyamino)imidazole ribonucleotide mutase
MQKKELMMNEKSIQPSVAIVMGSDSDYAVMKDAAAALEKLGAPFEISIVSAHRTPHAMVRFAEEARNRGIRVIIAGAGGAAHLPGMIASLTELPVIGVPVPMGHLQGQDALLSIVQMPKGVPVATVAIGNAWNAGVLAVQILGASQGNSAEEWLDRIASYKKEMRDQVFGKRLPI